MGETTFAWPVPDRTINVNGRPMSVEVVVAAALYGIGAVWLLWSIRSVVQIFPDLISGLFGSSFDFFFSWLVLLILALLFYVIALLGYTSVTLLRCDPVGRGLSAVITATLFFLMVSGASDSTIVLLTLISAGCTVVLFVSPWARRALGGESRHGRPWPVVLSQTLTVTFFVLIGVVGVSFLPGMRFANVVGVKVVFFVLLTLAASASALYGYQLLTKTPDRKGRLLVSAAWAVVLIAGMVSGSDSSALIIVGLASGATLPLWLASSSRAWFGEAPLQLNS